MNEKKPGPSGPVLANLTTLLPDLEVVYKDIHAHPELSMQETRTAGIAADRLRAAGFEVTTGIGKSGVVGLLRNGEGPCSHAARRYGRAPGARSHGRVCRIPARSRLPAPMGKPCL